MIATSQKNLTLGATVCTLALVAGYVWICRGDQPANKQMASDGIQKISVRDKTPPTSPQVVSARPDTGEAVDQPTRISAKKPEDRKTIEKKGRDRTNLKPKKGEKTPAV